ncbi:MULTISPECIES: NAD(P)/FAD-dependent oxidoreductase [Oscillospiraceae]|uniref:NAD(P)/FAD-dependent oxidoreductase n=1 Tax=Oscillospiraceae TaxID=216572 RepID=UPI000B379694|nr:NAD(P)/FAD-dependent oxidoreductase [Flavonifractor sp. An306]MBM6723616.1 NAD(P)/FAD-dependent oxidoreductase [Pseudoflavonifractor phocaeensis]OUO35407.1 thioredoxin reductase [Flavonifractor sp. An306]
MYDIAVIGGGPAGLSAAAQGRARGRSVLVVSGDIRDNPLYKTERIDNYLGFYNVTGARLLDQFRYHARRMGVEEKEGRVLNIMPMSGTFYLSIGSDMEQARAVVLATGVVRSAKYPGEEAHLGAGVSYCATCDGMLYRGKEIAVVGLTAGAPAEANWLREIGCKVTYVGPGQPDGLRPDILTVKAGKVEILGEQKVEGLRAGSAVIPCEGVFILRSSMAPTDLLPGLELEGNYLKVDRNMATNIPGVFAAGDCTGLPLQVSKAVGEGQVAGHRAAEYLEHLDQQV